jgi:hypothetical protein
LVEEPAMTMAEEKKKREKDRKNVQELKEHARICNEWSFSWQVVKPTLIPCYWYNSSIREKKEE